MSKLGNYGQSKESKRKQITEEFRSAKLGQELMVFSCAGEVWLDIRENLFLESMVTHLNRLPSKVVQSPSLEVFTNHVDVALRDMVSGHGGDRLMVGLGDLRELFQYS